MRSGDNGREAVRTGSYPLAAGDRVVALVDGARGTVIAVDEASDVFTVEWSDATRGDAIRYSEVALGVNFRKKLPWEQT